MPSDNEIDVLREKLKEKFRSMERIQAQEEVQKMPLREAMDLNKETYDRVYETQKSVFMNRTIAIKNKDKKDKAEELFNEYWNMFISKDVNSIREYCKIKKLNFETPEDDKCL
jgi:ubiquinone biosynthesis protein Coq4